MSGDGAYLTFKDVMNKEEIKVILELGSRDGEDAIILRDYFDADLVVSFECNPKAIERCQSRLKDEENILFVPLAVWHETEEITFYPVINGNHGASSAFRANKEYPYEQYKQSEIRVMATRLDEWWEKNMGDLKIDLICMDLQGAEMNAMIGMGDLLDQPRYVITECQFQRLYHDTPVYDDLEKHLSRYGFTGIEIRSSNSWFGDALFDKGHMRQSPRSCVRLMNE